MRLTLARLRQHLDLPTAVTAEELSAILTTAGLGPAAVVDLTGSVTGPLVVGRIIEIEELTGFRKPIRYSRVEVGAAEERRIVCGARNFAVGDLVVAALPGTILAGNFAIQARRTYGVISEGMLCSARELGIGDDHSTIVVLAPGTAAAPGDDARKVAGLDDFAVDLPAEVGLPEQ